MFFLPCATNRKIVLAKHKFNTQEQKKNESRDSAKVFDKEVFVKESEEEKKRAVARESHRPAAAAHWIFSK